MNQCFWINWLSERFSYSLKLKINLLCWTNRLTEWFSDSLVKAVTIYHFSHWCNLQKKSNWRNLCIHICHESGPWPSVRLPPEVALPLYWLSHHTDCYTSPWTTFPMFHCTDWIHLQPITHTLYYTNSDPAQVTEYCLAFITLLAIATLRSHSEFSELKYILACLLPESFVSWS